SFGLLPRRLDLDHVFDALIDGAPPSADPLAASGLQADVDGDKAQRYLEHYAVGRYDEAAALLGELMDESVEAQPELVRRAEASGNKGLAMVARLRADLLELTRDRLRDGHPMLDAEGEPAEAGLDIDEVVDPFVEAYLED